MISRVLLILAVSALILSSCSSLHTRTETDIYTIADVDTLRSYDALNAPGNRDNGVVYPSSTREEQVRDITMRDSIVERNYPDFIRLGLFEGVGLFGGDGDYAMGSGIFGVHPELGNLTDGFRGNSDALVPGGLYRLGIAEYRLRWFRDAKNWTIGTSAFEAIVPDARGEKILASILPIYLRKRYYLDEDIPYLAITPALGIGLYPSIYVNTSVSLDLGSIGGLNLRAYIGYAFGMNPTYTPQISGNDYASEAQNVSFPYAGLGVSVLDFLNLPKETETEWKDHKHSSWEIGLLDITLLSSNTDESIFASTPSNKFQQQTAEKDNMLISGMIFKLATAKVALPYLDYHLYAGTSLFNLVALGKDAFGTGILPLRVGYWHTLLNDELIAEPFIEYSYLPSQMLHIGAEFKLRLAEKFSIKLALGYVNGSTSTSIDDFYNSDWGVSADFSGVYAGIGFSILDRLFYSEELRYNK